MKSGVNFHNAIGVVKQNTKKSTFHHALMFKRNIINVFKGF